MKFVFFFSRLIGEMDEFGVLTERYGIKPQGKSAPMAASKRNPNNNGQSWNFGTGSGLNAKSTSFPSNSSWNKESSHGSLYDGDDIFFPANSTNRNGSNDFDVFSGLKKSSSSGDNSKSSLDEDLLFSNFGKKTSSDDDLFGGVMPGSKISGSVTNDDLFGSFSSSEKQYAAAVDDLLGLGKNEAGYDGLIPGFGASTNRFVITL